MESSRRAIDAAPVTGAALDLAGVDAMGTQPPPEPKPPLGPQPQPPGGPMPMPQPMQIRPVRTRFALPL